MKIRQSVSTKFVSDCSLSGISDQSSDKAGKNDATNVA